MSGVVNAGVIEAILRLRDELTPVLAKVNAGLQQSGTQMRTAGAAIMPISVAMTAVGVAGIKMATDLNASMANVASLIPGSTARVVELKQEVQAMAIATGKSTEDLAGGLYQVLSAFGDTSESAKILEINARSASAGLATTTDAINLTSAVTKGYGDTTAAAVMKASDLAMMTVRLGQTTFPELAASIGRVTPMSAALKVSQEELFGVMATFTGVTGGAAEVSTQLRGVLQSLMSPTDDMSKLMKSLGVESGAAMVQQLGLQGTIDKIVEAATAAGKPLQEYLSSIEGQTLALAASGGQHQAFTDKLAQMKNVVGATDAAFKEQTEGVNASGFAWAQLKQQIAVALQQIGDALLPVLVEAGQTIRPLLDWVLGLAKGFGEWPAPLRTAVVVVGGLVAVLGPLLFTLGSMVTAIGALTPLIGGFGTALAGLALNPVVLGITAVAAAIALVTYEMKRSTAEARNNIESFKENKALMEAYQKVTGDTTAKISDFSKYTAEQKASLLAMAKEASTAALNAGGLTLNLGDLQLALDKSGKATAGAHKPTVVLTEAQEKLKKEIAEIALELTGGKANAEMLKLAAAVQLAGGASNLAAPQLRRVVEQVQALREQGATVPATLQNIKLSIDGITRTGVSFFDQFQARNDELLVTLPGVAGAVGDFMEKLTPRNDQLTFFLPLNEGLDDFMKNLTARNDDLRGWATRAGAGMKSGFLRSIEGLGDIIVGAIQGGGDVGRAAGAHIGKGIGEDLATQILGESKSKLLKGALSFLGPLGSLAGSALGGIFGGIFGKSEARKELEAYNVKIGEMREQLLKTYGSLQDIATLDRALGTDVAAGWGHQGKIGAAAFSKSSEELARRLQAVRDEMGRITSEGGLASQSLIQFRNAMPGDEGVQAFVLGQVKAAGTYVTQFLENAKIRTEAGASAMSSILLAAWDGSAAGLRDLGPTFVNLQKQLEGLRNATLAAGGDASGWNKILSQVGSVADLAAIVSNEVSGPMVTAINAGTGALTAMYNAGFLTQDTFSGMVTEIMAQRQALIGTGATSQQVNAVMRNDLQRIWELMKDGNYQVDEATKKLLDEAEAAGSVGDRFRSTEERMVLILERIATMFQTVFGDKLTAEAQRGAEAARRALEGIPTDYDVNINYRTGGGFPRPGGYEEALGYKGGTHGRYIDFGAGTPVVLHGRERVMTEAEGRSGGVTIHVNGAVIREEQDIKKLTLAIAREVKLQGWA